MKNGKFPCFHCGAYEVIWNGDFMASEYGYEVEGIIHECSCQSCGAQITYYVPDKEEEWKEYKPQAPGEERRDMYKEVVIEWKIIMKKSMHNRNT